MDVVQPAQDKIPRACVECLVEDYIDPVREKAPVMVSLLTPIPVILLALVEATLRVALAVITVLACPFLLGFAMCDFFFAERGLTLYVENLENIERSLTVFLETLPCEIGSLYSYCSNEGKIPVLSSKSGDERKADELPCTENPIGSQTVKPSGPQTRKTSQDLYTTLAAYRSVGPSALGRTTNRAQRSRKPIQERSEVAIAAKQEPLSFTQAAANLSVATIASEVFAEKAAEEAREVEALDRAYAKPRVEAVEGVPNQYGIYFI